MSKKYITIVAVVIVTFLALFGGIGEIIETADSDSESPEAGRRGFQWDRANSRLEVYVDGTEIARFDDATNDLQLVGSNGMTINAGGQTITAGGQTITAGGQTITAGGQTITAGGQTITAGGQTITADGQTITAGGQTITAGGQTITAGGSTITAGGLTVTAGGIDVNGGDIDFGGGNLTGFRMGYEAHTSNDTLTVAESGSVHSNFGLGSGNVSLTLPQSGVLTGTHYTFAVAAAYPLLIDAGAAGAIYMDGSKGTDNYVIWADDEGESVEIIYLGSGDWLAYSRVGTWTASAS